LPSPPPTLNPLVPMQASEGICSVCVSFLDRDFWWFSYLLHNHGSEMFYVIFLLYLGCILMYALAFWSLFNVLIRKMYGRVDLEEITKFTTRQITKPRIYNPRGWSLYDSFSGVQLPQCARKLINKKKRLHWYCVWNMLMY